MKSEQRLKSGARIATSIPQAIGQSASALLVVSAASANSGWVEEEYGAFLDQRTSYREYRIVVLRLDNTTPPAFLKGTTWIEVPDRALTADLELSVLSGSMVMKPQFHSDRGTSTSAEPGGPVKPRPQMAFAGF